MDLKRLSVLSMLLALTTVMVLPAQSDDAAATYTPAQRSGCDGDYPPYPNKALNESGEGWVDMRFTVTAGGKVQDIVVDRQLGRGAFGEYSAKWLEGCKYQPAMRNGVPIDDHNMVQRFYFKLSPGEVTVSPESLASLYNVNKLLDQGKVEDATNSLEKISEKSTLLYEMVHVMARQAQAMYLLGKHDIAFLYMQGLGGSTKFLPPKEEAELQRLRLLLALTEGRYREAKTAAAQIGDLGQQVGDAQLKTLLDRIEAIAASDAPLGIDGRIPTECRPELCGPIGARWTYAPVRRTISLTDIQGRLDTVHIWCDARTFSTAAQAGTAWTIPASWGSCNIAITGDPGTTFRLIDENK